VWRVTVTDVRQLTFSTCCSIRVNNSVGEFVLQCLNTRRSTRSMWHAVRTYATQLRKAASTATVHVWDSSRQQQDAHRLAVAVVVVVVHQHNSYTCRLTSPSLTKALDLSLTITDSCGSLTTRVSFGFHLLFTSAVNVKKHVSYNKTRNKNKIQ